jgi:hypothetical protein
MSVNSIRVESLFNAFVVAGGLGTVIGRARSNSMMKVSGLEFPWAPPFPSVFPAMGIRKDRYSSGFIYGVGSPERQRRRSDDYERYCSEISFWRNLPWPESFCSRCNCLFGGKVCFCPLQIQCHSLSIDKDNASVDQFLASAIIFLIASQCGERDHELH